MLFASLMLSALFVSVYHYIKSTLPAKQTRRLLGQNEFRQFALANRNSVVTPVQIEDFWSRTNDTHALYGNTVITQLRNELYDNALQLSNTRSRLDDDSLSLQLNERLIKSHSDTVQWFSVTLVQMESLFVEYQASQITFCDVWNELVFLLGRSIRA